MHSMIDIDRAIALRNDIDYAHTNFLTGVPEHELPASHLIRWWETNTELNAHVFGGIAGDAYAITWLAYVFNHDVTPVMETLAYFKARAPEMDYLYVDHHTITDYFSTSQHFRDIFTLPLSPFVDDTGKLINKGTTTSQEIGVLLQPTFLYGIIPIEHRLNPERLQNTDHRNNAFSKANHAIIQFALRNALCHDDAYIVERFRFIHRADKINNGFDALNAVLTATDKPFADYPSFTQDFFNDAYSVAMNPKNKDLRSVFNDLLTVPNAVSPALIGHANPYALALYEMSEGKRADPLSLAKHNMLIHAPIEQVVCAPMNDAMMDLYMALTGYTPMDLFTEQTHPDTRQRLIKMLADTSHASAS